MKSIYEDLPAALVSATLCIAAASMFVVIFANMAWARRHGHRKRSPWLRGSRPERGAAPPGEPGSEPRPAWFSVCEGLPW